MNYKKQIIENSLSVNLDIGQSKGGIVTQVNIFGGVQDFQTADGQKISKKMSNYIILEKYNDQSTKQINKCYQMFDKFRDAIKQESEDDQ